MADQAESSPRTPPLPPPPPPALSEESSSEAILWPASDSSSSSTPHTDLLSLWLSNYAAPPQPEAEEESFAVVPTLLNFDLQSSFPDLVDWSTTNTAVTQAPVVTQPLWMQLHAPAGGEVDDLLQLALGIQSPKASILPLPLGIQPGPPASSKTVAPQASLSPLALGLQSPPGPFGTQPPPAPISPLALGTEPYILPPARGIQFPEASILPPISPLALGIQSPQISLGIHSAPSSFSSLPPIPCTLPVAPPLWNLPSNPCTLPMAPPLSTFLPSSFSVPERRSWSAFLSTTPPARPQFLLPHSASACMSSPSSHPSHQPHNFFPAADTGSQQQVPVAHTPVTISPPNANANFSTGFVPASRPLWSQAMASRRSWTPNQPWISSGQDMELLIPRFLLPPTATTVPAPPPLLANFGSSMGNMPSWNARGDVPVGDHQRIQLGESSRPRKRSKLALDLSGSEASHWSHDGAEVALIAREKFVVEPALNRNGKARALPGTSTDARNLFARYKREKVRQRIKILQKLIPNGDKVHTVILLEQAHIHIKFLEQQIKLLKSSLDWKLAMHFAYNDMDLLHPR